MSYCTHCGAEVPEEAAACPSCRRPLTVWEAPPIPARRAAAGVPPPPPGAVAAPGGVTSQAAPAAPRRGLSRRGWLFAGLGCFVGVVSVAGVLAALVVPNFLEALHQAKQKRTIVDLGYTGVALEHYRAENVGVPATADFADLARFLVPEPLAGLTTTDGWQHTLRYECTEKGGPTGCARYRIGSPGRDGVWERQSLTDYVPEATGLDAFDRDIVYGDGLFVQSPEGP